MEKLIKRPFSVWITQVLLAVGILGAPLVFLTKIFKLFFYCSTNELEKCSYTTLILDLICNFLILGLIVLAFVGLQKQKLYGRWLGVIFLILIILFMVAESHYFQLVYNLIIMKKPLPNPPYDCWQRNLGSLEETYCGYKNYLDFWIRGFLDIFFPSSLLGLLAIHLGASQATNRFFGVETKR